MGHKEKLLTFFIKKQINHLANRIETWIPNAKLATILISLSSVEFVDLDIGTDFAVMRFRRATTPSMPVRL